MSLFGEWECDVCTYPSNPNSAVVCVMCDRPRKTVEAEADKSFQETPRNEVENQKGLAPPPSTQDGNLMKLRGTDQSTCKSSPPSVTSPPILPPSAQGGTLSKGADASAGTSEGGGADGVISRSRELSVEQSGDEEMGDEEWGNVRRSPRVQARSVTSRRTLAARRKRELCRNLEAMGYHPADCAEAAASCSDINEALEFIAALSVGRAALSTESKPTPSTPPKESEEDGERRQALNGSGGKYTPVQAGGSLSGSLSSSTGAMSRLGGKSLIDSEEKPRGLLSSSPAAEASSRDKVMRSQELGRSQSRDERKGGRQPLLSTPRRALRFGGSPGQRSSSPSAHSGKRRRVSRTPLQVEKVTSSGKKQTTLMSAWASQATKNLDTRPKTKALSSGKIKKEDERRISDQPKAEPDQSFVDLLNSGSAPFRREDATVEEDIEDFEVDPTGWRGGVTEVEEVEEVEEVVDVTGRDGEDEPWKKEAPLRAKKDSKREESIDEVGTETWVKGLSSAQKEAAAELDDVEVGGLIKRKLFGSLHEEREGHMNTGDCTTKPHAQAVIAEDQGNEEEEPIVLEESEDDSLAGNRTLGKKGVATPPSAHGLGRELDEEKRRRKVMSSRRISGELLAEIQRELSDDDEEEVVAPVAPRRRFPNLDVLSSDDDEEAGKDRSKRLRSLQEKRERRSRENEQLRSDRDKRASVSRRESGVSIELNESSSDEQPVAPYTKSSGRKRTGVSALERELDADSEEEEIGPKKRNRIEKTESAAAEVKRLLSGVYDEVEEGGRGKTSGGEVRDSRGSAEHKKDKRGDSHSGVSGRTAADEEEDSEEVEVMAEDDDVVELSETEDESDYEVDEGSTEVEDEENGVRGDATSVDEDEFAEYAIALGEPEVEEIEEKEEDEHSDSPERRRLSHVDEEGTLHIPEDSDVDSALDVEEDGDSPEASFFPVRRPGSEVDEPKRTVVALDDVIQEVESDERPPRPQRQAQLNQVWPGRKAEQDPRLPHFVSVKAIRDAGHRDENGDIVHLDYRSQFGGLHDNAAALLRDASRRWEVREKRQQQGGGMSGRKKKGGSKGASRSKKRSTGAAAQQPTFASAASMSRGVASSSGFSSTGRSSVSSRPGSSRGNVHARAVFPRNFSGSDSLSGEGHRAQVGNGRIRGWRGREEEESNFQPPANLEDMLPDEELEEFPHMEAYEFAGGMAFRDGY